MALELFWGSGSPYSWRALLTLEHKGLEYTSHIIQFSKGDHKAPSYLAMNPRGKVPVLKDGDFTLYESLAIMHYIDAKYPERPLFGTTPEQKGLINRLISEFSAYAARPTMDVVLPLFFGAAGKEDAIRAGMDTVHGELKRWESILEDSDWLAGATLTAADIVLFPSLQSLMRAAGKDAAAPLQLGLLPLKDNYPALAAWCARIEALPYYDKTYPPHWR